MVVDQGNAGEDYRASSRSQAGHGFRGRRNSWTTRGSEATDLWDAFLGETTLGRAFVLSLMPELSMVVSTFGISI